MNDNPQVIAFFVFDPVTLVRRLGSFGIDSITAVIAAQSFNVQISSGIGGSPLTTSQVEDLHIVPSVKEIFPGYTITPAAGGFVIDFGAPLVRSLSIKIEKLLGE